MLAIKSVFGQVLDTEGLLPEHNGIAPLRLPANAGYWHSLPELVSGLRTLVR